MCGIVAVVAAPPTRRRPERAEVEPVLEEAIGQLHRAALAPDATSFATALRAAVAGVDATDVLLGGAAGVLGLVHDRTLSTTVDHQVAALEVATAAVEARLESMLETSPDAALEELNAVVVALRDGVWAVGHDRLRTAHDVAAMAGPEASDAALVALYGVQVTLASIDRLEVRGRDSAGVHLFVTGHGLDLASRDVVAMLAGRADGRLFASGAVRVAGDVLSFVYKAAAEVGELGDNTRVLRAAITSDELLHRALRAPEARAAVLGHTRWASVGLISEANAHPLNAEEVPVERGPRVAGPYVVAALNGDVDNHADLRAAHGLQIPPEITTDAKVIPALVARARAGVADTTEAFRRTVASFDGSVAIAAATAEEPHRLLLALRGSGQALYVGFAEDCFVVASEPYGLVEVTSEYLRLDGETPARADQPSSSRGQVVVLDGRRAGTVEGVERFGYDGTPLPVDATELARAEITTRDIDRRGYPHYLLKELSEAPSSFRKTLRGRVAERDGLLVTSLGPEVLPMAVRRGLADGTLVRVVVIGQGTAAVAGQSLAATLGALTDGHPIRVEAVTATEFSGFGLPSRLDDTVVVAVSQSGTTTDTNRTVDLARARGASVIAIVNRRGSDLTDRADGVLYTSDGRDVEMSVASTKAFYAQVAAGCLLAVAIAETIGSGGAAGARHRSELLAGLRALPAAMEVVLTTRAEVARAAHELAPPRRYWAVVGSGSNRIAAAEARIKLSELCYKSIACDVTEDKKHIDLSSEPLILVCAAGLVGSTADDIAKEVAIYRAHKAAPVVVATEGEERFGAALSVLTVPSAHPDLAFVLSAMVGHLFGYEAALAIDAQARPLRAVRGAVEDAVIAGASGDEVLASLEPSLVALGRQVADSLRSGALNGHLEAATAVALMGVLRFAAGWAPLDAYEVEHGKVGTPAVVVEDLVAALSLAIEELTRPIDAIKHQAKTVTVGISRSDEALLGNRLVQAVVAAGAGRDRLAYRTLRTLADLDPAVEGVLGSTRYRLEGDAETSSATLAVVDRAGISLSIPSRVDRSPGLRGTKRGVAVERKVLVARGRSDGRTVLFVPEVKGSQTVGITLLQIRLATRLPAPVARGVLQGYRDRYAQLRDLVTETEPTFRDDLLADIDVVELLTGEVVRLAEHWRSTDEP